MECFPFVSSSLKGIFVTFPFVCSRQHVSKFRLRARPLSLACVSVGAMGFKSGTLGLYQTSFLVRKSRKFSKSGLSRNETFSFQDAELLRIEKKFKFSLNFSFQIFFFQFFFKSFFKILFWLFIWSKNFWHQICHMRIDNLYLVGMNN